MNTSRTSAPEIIDATAAAWIGRRDAGLTESEQRDFERWRNADPRHGEALARFDAAWSALARPRQTGAASALAGELGALARRQRRRRTGTALGLLACLALGAGWGIQHTLSETGAAQTIVLLPERRVLPDNSVVEFPAGTEIEIGFTPAVRKIILKRGEAHFQVVKETTRAFVVEAAGVEVRAVGTAFAVQLGRTTVEVLVTEGTVAVEPPRPLAADSAPRALATVEAGQRVSVATAVAAATATLPPVLPVPASEMEERLAWRSPRVEFSGTPLADVVAAINRYSRVKFVIEDAELGATALSGLFRPDDTEAVVRMLEQGFGVRAERREGEIFLRQAR